MDHMSLAVILPLVGIQFVLCLISLVDMARRQNNEVTFGKKWPWVLIVLLVSGGIGSVMYLVAGRKSA